MKEPREAVMLTEKITIPPGATGYKAYPIDVNIKGKQDYNLEFRIDVEQPSGRTDLDIRFFVVDDENYHKWLINQPITAYVIAPRVISARFIYTPLSNGKYYAILENKYSSFTSKTVHIKVIEKWLEEVEVPVIEKGVERIGEKLVATKPASKFEKLKQIFSRLIHSRSFGFVLLFFFIQFLCVVTYAGLVHFIRSNFDSTFKDGGSYLAALAGGGITLFIALFVMLTGRQLSITPSPIS